MTRRKSADQLWSELSCHFGPEHAAILMHDEKMAIREAILREATPDRADPERRAEGREHVEDALWDQWTAGEKLAYGVGYRRGRAAALTPPPAGNELSREEKLRAIAENDYSARDEALRLGDDI